MFSKSTARLAGYPVLAILITTPLLEGVLPVVTLAMLTPAAVLTLFAYGSSAAPVWTKKVALSIVSMCVMATLVDLIARPVFLFLREDRPAIISPIRLPEVPEIYRFRAASAYSGPLYGDLAAMAGREEWRETRDITFETDDHGFRNSIRAGDDPRPLDIIMLGDSFGVGTGVSQEKTWFSLLQSRHGLVGYNLSVDGESPWQEYITLCLEVDRLNLKPGTQVLWSFFEGNDLDDAYLPIYNVADLPRPSSVAGIIRSFRDFRYRSPLRQLLLRDGAPRDKVIRRELGQDNVLFYQDCVDASARTAESIQSHPNFGQMKDTISAMRKIAEQKKLRIAIIFIPDKSRIYNWILDGADPWTEDLAPSPFAQSLSEIAGREGFTFLDLTQPLYQAARDAYSKEPRSLIWWKDDTHWNDLGHEVAAAAVYESLIRDVPR